MLGHGPHPHTHAHAPNRTGPGRAGCGWRVVTTCGHECNSILRVRGLLHFCIVILYSKINSGLMLRVLGVKWSSEFSGWCGARSGRCSQETVRLWLWHRLRMETVFGVTPTTGLQLWLHETATLTIALWDCDSDCYTATVIATLIGDYGEGYALYNLVSGARTLQQLLRAILVTVSLTRVMLALIDD